MKHKELDRRSSEIKMDNLQLLSSKLVKNYRNLSNRRGVKMGGTKWFNLSHLAKSPTSQTVHYPQFAQYFTIFLLKKHWENRILQ